MESYGRPLVARRNTSPNVSFLNDAKTRTGATAFAPPTSSRNQENETLELQVTGGRAGGHSGAPSSDIGSANGNGPFGGASTAPTLFTHLSRPPPLTGRPPPLERPQSGGVRRQAPGAPPPAAAMAKQRPSTARESSRTGDRVAPSPPTSLERDELFTRRRSDARPEVDDPEIPGEESPVGGGIPHSSKDEAYIRQLKADISYCHKVLALHQTASANREAPTTSRSHTHVKNVQNMRESRAPSHNPPPLSTLDAALYSQLARYNFSSDPAQLQSAKARLEDMLTQSLTQLMRHFLQLKDDVLDHTRASATDNETPEHDVESIGLQRPTGDLIPFGNGCGYDPGSVYTGCVVGILRRVEKFRSVIMALHSEKTCLLKEIHEKDRNTERLCEQLDLFKDALAKAKLSTHSGERHSRRIGANLTVEDSPSPILDSSPRLEMDIERELELSAQIHGLEKERVHLNDVISKMQSEQRRLEAQIQLMQADAEKYARGALAAQEQLDQARFKSAEDVRLWEQREGELQDALRAMTERCRQLEDGSNREKQALRSEKLDLEARIRRLEEELRAKTGLASQNATTIADLKRYKDRFESASAQLKSVEGNLAEAQREAGTARTECEKSKAVVEQLRLELSAATARIEDLAARHDQSLAFRATQETTLRQAKLKLAQADADVQRQCAVIQHQANQLALLEDKLSKSVSLDEEQQKQRQIQEETAWHQKVAALEHALAVERQTIQSLKEQHLTSMAMEREKAKHSVSQAKAIAQELETANLCLAERKKQRERELQDFADQKAQLLDRIAQLTHELEAANATITQQTRTNTESVGSVVMAELEGTIRDLQEQLVVAIADHKKLQVEASNQVDQLRREYESKQRSLEESHRQAIEDEIETYKSAAENALAAELDVRHQLDVVIAERDVLLHRIHDERATPRGSALSEARVELQRAKLKIAALEEKLHKPDSARHKESEGKAALLVAREKKLAEDQKSLKKAKQELSADKKQLRGDREALETEKSRVEADKLRNRDDHKLLRQIIALLASRLGLQMQLLDILPPELAAARRDPFSSSHQARSRRTESPQSLDAFISTFKTEHADQWRDMQVQWERLHLELDDSDWQLVHMRNRLEELHLASATVRPKTAPVTTPFSDAVAAGRDTVPIAEQLASASKAAITTAIPPPPTATSDTSDDRPSSARPHTKDEDPETFAVALAKEMRAMRDSYERQLEELQLALRTAQTLRVESGQRLRAELDDEKRRSHQLIAQWTDRCVALEAQLEALRRVLATLQDAQIAALRRHREAANGAARHEALGALHAAVASAWADEMARRDAHEQDRMRKLLDYCGSSSVTVERDDKTRLV